MQQLRRTTLELNLLGRSSEFWSAIAGRRPVARDNDYMHHLAVPNSPAEVVTLSIPIGAFEIRNILRIGLPTETDARTTAHLDHCCAGVHGACLISDITGDSTFDDALHDGATRATGKQELQHRQGEAECVPTGCVMA